MRQRASAAQFKRTQATERAPRLCLSARRRQVAMFEMLVSINVLAARRTLRRH